MPKQIDLDKLLDALELEDCEVFLNEDDFTGEDEYEPDLSISFQESW